MNDLLFIAGPCSVESEEQIFQSAAALAKLGVQVLRGGTFKARTSPHTFQGLGLPGAKLLAQEAKAHGMQAISEVLTIEQIEQLEPYVDIFQVGSRNMYNYALLKELNKTQKPVLIKRGFSATYHELRQAASYVAQNGKNSILLCERGIRTFETETRNTLDLNAIPVLQNTTDYPVIVDPSHGTGSRELIKPMTLAAVAAGANGIMIETHPNPDQALSDAKQTISLEQFADIHEKATKLHQQLYAMVPA